MKEGMMREATFAALLAIAGLLVVAGIAMLFVPLALVVAGPLVAVWSWLILHDDGSETT